jgi:hypothetical protein
LIATEQRIFITLMRLACSSGFHLPKTLNLKEDPCNYGNNSKERITVLLGCHANGTDRLPALVTGKMKTIIAKKCQKVDHKSCSQWKACVICTDFKVVRCRNEFPKHKDFSFS